ncbi:uncharacterized protein BKA78DRAFT_296205 [Phyllosticta capitalensis]|uniref:uncharacterized protein n=1 Tax=Phyllosticta capitalensis TaxID=121624 RepID=UPI0031307216
MTSFVAVAGSSSEQTRQARLPAPTFHDRTNRLGLYRPKSSPSPTTALHLLIDSFDRANLLNCLHSPKPLTFQALVDGTLTSPVDKYDETVVGADLCKVTAYDLGLLSRRRTLRLSSLSVTKPLAHGTLHTSSIFNDSRPFATDAHSDRPASTLFLRFFNHL